MAAIYDTMRYVSDMEELLAEHTGQPRERIYADIERDTILTASEALAYGLVDEVLPARQQRSLARAA